METLPCTKVYQTALYMRLSKDDDLHGESESIQNQRRILNEFALENGMQVADEYIDDGWSGTNFNRPAFKRMIEDIERGRINCVLTKDLSRLGRNYLEVGRYTETYFPARSVRYIAVNDRVDTAAGDSDIAPFMNIFNEFHAKQTSKKVRQVYETKFAQGACHYTCAPIGYKKDPEQKSHLIIDEDTAWIVQKMFELAAAGQGARSIQKWLYDHRIETPGYREYRLFGLHASAYAHAPKERKYEWGLTNIRNILKREVYLGSSVHYKERSISFKNKMRRKLPREDWIVVDNTHAPLVSRAQFELVQKQLASRKRRTQDGDVQLFSGIARCADCGWYMRFATNRQRPGSEYQYLTCGKQNEGGRRVCSLHYIRYDALKAVVLKRIQEIFHQTRMDKASLLEKLEKGEQQNAAAFKQKDVLLRREGELKRLIPRLYEDWAAGRLQESVFSSMSSVYQQELSDIEEKLSAFQEAPFQTQENIKKWSALIDSWTEPKELTRELLETFVEKILISEAVGAKGSRKKTQKIEIYWKFIGPL